MKFIIIGKNIDVTPGLREAVESKLGKLERYFTPNTEIHVTLSVQKGHQKIEVTKGGLIIPEYDGAFKNPDTGEKDTEYQLSVVANVIEVSPLCKFVKPGDDIYYRRSSGVTVPFFRQGFEVGAEQQVQVVINEGLKERFSKL